jgi:hypothetical protein
MEDRKYNKISHLMVALAERNEYWAIRFHANRQENKKIRVQGEGGG